MLENTRSYKETDQKERKWSVDPTRMVEKKKTNKDGEKKKEQKARQKRKEKVGGHARKDKKGGQKRNDK